MNSSRVINKMELITDPMQLVEFLDVHPETVTDVELVKAALVASVAEKKDPSIINVLMSTPGGQRCLAGDPILLKDVQSYAGNAINPNHIPRHKTPSQFKYRIDTRLRSTRIDDVDDMQFTPIPVQVHIIMRRTREWITPEDLVELYKGNCILRMQCHQDSPDETSYCLVYLRPTANIRSADELAKLAPYLGRGLVAEFTAQYGHFLFADKVDTPPRAMITID